MKHIRQSRGRQDLVLEKHDFFRIPRGGLARGIQRMSRSVPLEWCAAKLAAEMMQKVSRPNNAELG